jgi:hypothetical protein
MVAGTHPVRPRGLGYGGGRAEGPGEGSETALNQIRGVRETIVALRKIDPQLRKDFNKRARDIAKPIVLEARRRYTQVPLSGMSRRWAPRGRDVFPFTVSGARKGVRVKIDTSKRLNRGPARPVGIVSVKQVDAAAVIFDMAGKATDNQLARNLAARWGPPSRVMWPAAEQELPQVEREMAALVRDTERTIQAALNRVN